MTSHHSKLAAQRWLAMDICEQLANVGSEVERTLRARASGKTERFDSALERALELFDWTAQDDRWRGPRRREVLRARSEFVRLFFDPDCDPRSADGLRRYFLAFAVRARMGRS